MIMFCYLFEFMYSCHTCMSHQYIKISYPCVLTDNSQERQKKLYYKLIKHKKYHCASIYGDIKDDTDENGNEYKIHICKIQ